MTFEAALEKADQADQLRQNREFIAAGDAYLEAAHEYFGDNKGRHAIENIFYAIVCYRLSNDDREIIAQKRRFGCAMAVEYCRYRVLEESDRHPETDSYRAVRAGAWREFAGDVLLANGESEYSDEYDAATEWYQENSDLDLSIIEEEHIRLLDMYRSIAVGAGKGETWETIQEMKLHYNDGSLTDWLALKRETLPPYIDLLTEEREWAWKLPESE